MLERHRALLRVEVGGHLAAVHRGVHRRRQLQRGARLHRCADHRRGQALRRGARFVHAGRDARRGSIPRAPACRDARSARRALRACEPSRSACRSASARTSRSPRDRSAPVPASQWASRPRARAARDRHTVADSCRADRTRFARLRGGSRTCRRAARRRSTAGRSLCRSCLRGVPARSSVRGDDPSAARRCRREPGARRRRNTPMLRSGLRMNALSLPSGCCCTIRYSVNVSSRGVMTAAPAIGAVGGEPHRRGVARAVHGRRRRDPVTDDAIALETAAERSLSFGSAKISSRRCPARAGRDLRNPQSILIVFSRS